MQCYLLLFITRVTSIKDLGVTFDDKLLFDKHINLMVSKALRMLGFVKRSTASFSSITAIKVLYFAFVYSILNYCSVVWCPQYQTYISRIERIQKKIIKYLCFKCSIHYSDYFSSCKHFGVLTLSQRRVCGDVLFFFKLLHNIRDSPSLLNAINLHVPPRSLRFDFLFFTPTPRTNALLNSPMIRMARAVDGIDVNLSRFQSSSLIAFRRALFASFRE